MAISAFNFAVAVSVICYTMLWFSSAGALHEKTLAIIKPDGVYGNYSDMITGIIHESGFRIVRERIIQLDEDTVGSFYAEHSSKSFFASLVKYMTSGPVLILVLEKENAVADWRALIGPTDANKAKLTHPKCIRAMCGVDAEKNCVHGSDSIQSAIREIKFFFTIPSVLMLLSCQILGQTDVGSVQARTEFSSRSCLSLVAGCRDRTADYATGLFLGYKLITSSYPKGIIGEPNEIEPKCSSAGCKTSLVEEKDNGSTRSQMLFRRLASICTSGPLGVITWRCNLL
ncbi:putative nucleoside diphosphate kinase 5 [Drosera capensis]